ncbi:MAG: alpha-amylase family glycosyl hydrolase [Fimbriimonas sp.]|nr:alpha-amylase family glycosyl hydrolase [Fimbriimonas sp.]
MTGAILLLTASIFSAQSNSLLHLDFGPLSIDFDSTTGAMLEARYSERVIARGSARAFPVTFATGSADKPIWIDSTGVPPRLIRHEQPTTDTLELTICFSDFELLETYQVHTHPMRLDRSLRLTYRGSTPVKLRDLYFRTPGIVAPPEGFARFPGNWPPTSYSFGSMKPGVFRWGGGSIAPAGLQLAPDLTLFFASYTQDSPGISMVEGRGSVEMRQSVAAQGILKADVPQEIGTVSMLVSPSPYRDALPSLWKWMDDVGLKVPADRPDWVNGAVIYGFHPGGTIGSGFKDQGGFEAATERLLPDIPRLGATAIWVLPIESESPYWPKDYYALMDGIGTFDQYRAMVARAHQLGLHVLQDLVPHGGSPRAVHNIQHPEFMLRKEDGTTFDYWLNDFGNPGWQRYIADVARHYVKDFDVDGYRVDACYGSKEPNWSPSIPYSRASLAVMQGGLGMDSGIRNAVREIKPRDGAILAEVESARHAACSDIQYDFALCYNVLDRWAEMPAADFASQLQTFLDERQYAYPRGTLLLRHIESHDSLRSQLRFGVEGMHAMYALAAWIDGVPLIYHNMDIGNTAAIAEINAVRHLRPEIARGEALYRSVQCDTPGVFTCLRHLGSRNSVVVINFNREPVQTKLTWPGGQARVSLKPLGYTVVPEDSPPPSPTSAVYRTSTRLSLPDRYALSGAKEWFVDTLEGRLQGDFRVARTSGNPVASAGIYWRPPIPSLVWRAAMLPLDPARPRIGYRTADGVWHVIDFANSDCGDMRMVERLDGKEGLFLVSGTHPMVSNAECKAIPPARDVTASCQFGPCRLRSVGNEILISNGSYTVAVCREGGLVRWIERGGKRVQVDHNMYGDQAAFATGSSRTIEAKYDAECGARIWVEGGILHLRFEGQLRGKDRFDIKNPPVDFANEYAFGTGNTFRHRWGFRSEGGVSGQVAFLAETLSVSGSDTFRFGRKDLTADVGGFHANSGRQAQSSGASFPDRIEFFRSGTRLWSLSDFHCPSGGAPDAFVDMNLVFLTLLDGSSTMDKGRWYDFACTWEL